MFPAVLYAVIVARAELQSVSYMFGCKCSLNYYSLYKRSLVEKINDAFSVSFRLFWSLDPENKPEHLCLQELQENPSVIKQPLLPMLHHHINM